MDITWELYLLINTWFLRVQIKGCCFLYEDADHHRHGLYMKFNLPDEPQLLAYSLPFIMHLSMILTYFECFVLAVFSWECHLKINLQHNTQTFQS